MTSSGSRANTWKSDQRYRALDYHFRIRTDYLRFAKMIDGYLTQFHTHRVRDDVAMYSVIRTADPYMPVALILDGDELSVATRPTSLQAALLVDISRRAISSVRGSLAVHAGVVSLDGRGIILPAPSNSGKTTLVAGLVRAGFSYLSDEGAIVDLRTGLLRPFPRPLAMGGPSLGAVFGDASPEARAGARMLPGFASFFSPDAVRPGALGRGCHVDLVIAPLYQQGSATALESMSRADAVIWMASNSFNLRTVGAPGMHLLRDIVERARCYRLRVGDLPSAVAAVESLLEEGGAMSRSLTG